MTETYENDPGLLQLASSQAKCWGHFANHKECRSCPILVACEMELIKKRDLTAAALDAEWELQNRSKTLDETELSSLEERLKRRYAPYRVSYDFLSFFGFCGHCRNAIPSGNRVFHILDVGTFHPRCMAPYLTQVDTD